MDFCFEPSNLSQFYGEHQNCVIVTRKSVCNAISLEIIPKEVSLSNFSVFLKNLVSFILP